MHFDVRLTPLFEDAMRAYELPGAAVGVVAHRQVVYARGFGVRSTQTREPVLATTLFHMASISKPFVATAVMQLVEQGLVEIDAPVVQYLRYFTLADERYRAITVQQMLSHVSGMPDVKDYEWHTPQYDDGALERYVRSLSSQRLLFAPGERFEYSNMAFECLGALIAEVSGQTFDDYVQEHILNPTGMTESTLLKPAHLPDNWAAPHVRMLADEEWDGYPYNRAHGPSSTLHSSALDMCHWAIANLNRGSFEGRRILETRSYDLLWSPRARLDYASPVGLSWFLEQYRGERMVWRGGGDTGFETYLALLPDRGAAMVVLSNLIPARVGNLGDAALDILLGHEPAPIRPLAMLVVRKTLAAQGVDAAVAQWNSLQATHSDDYDWSAIQPGMLHNAVSLDRLQDAQSLAGLCARLLPEHEIQDLEDSLDGCGNQAALAALAVIREHLRRAGARPGPSSSAVC